METKREGDEVLNREPYTTPAKDNKKYGTIAVVVLLAAAALLGLGAYLN